MNDVINRKDTIGAILSVEHIAELSDGDAVIRVSAVNYVLRNLPPAQSEIIRCKDCKYSDENWRRVSVRWLPCMDMRTGSNWYCGSAERREE